MKAATLRRLGRLEAILSDRSGLAPQTPAWFEFWERKAHNILNGDESGRIPLEFWDAIDVTANLPGDADNGE